MVAQGLEGKEEAGGPAEPQPGAPHQPPEDPGPPRPAPAAHPPCLHLLPPPRRHRGSRALQTTGVAWPTRVGSVPSLASKSLLQSQKQILLWIWACWKQVCVPGLPSHLWQNSALGSQTRDSVQSSWARPAGEDRGDSHPPTGSLAGLSPRQPMKRSHLPSTFWHLLIAQARAPALVQGPHHCPEAYSPLSRLFCDLSLLQNPGPALLHPPTPLHLLNES